MKNKFKLVEIKSNGDKEYYIEGHVSTIDPDFVNDIVDKQGQIATNRDLQNYDITMDEDHDEWRDPISGEVYDGKKNKLPIAKVVSSKVDELGTWTRVLMNKHHPNFEQHILPSIKKGFLHSFSIAYKPIKSFKKVIDGTTYRIIQDLKIGNVAITGNPVNKNAKFNLALKSFNKMVKEKTIEELTADIVNLKSLHKQEVEKLNTVLKAKDNKYDNDMSQKEKELEDLKKNKKDDKDSVEKTEMKSLISTQNQELVALKSQIITKDSELLDLKSKVQKYESEPMLKDIKMFQDRAVEMKSKLYTEKEELKPYRANI